MLVCCFSLFFGAVRLHHSFYDGAPSANKPEKNCISLRRLFVSPNVLPYISPIRYSGLLCLRDWIQILEKTWIFPGEDMDVYKYIVSLRHGGNLNSRRSPSTLVRATSDDRRTSRSLTCLKLWQLSFIQEGQANNNYLTFKKERNSYFRKVLRNILSKVLTYYIIDQLRQIEKI
ncbi:hypothetical protein TNCV_3098851 [Trichonephila clavipes]|nr:hypothetical protein TNCV_3098851 [Trichonephila clavipes]